MTWQPAPLLYPDVEAWAVNYLTAALVDRDEDYASNVHISNRVPNPRTARMVIFTRDGGVPVEVFDEPRLRVRVWAETTEDVNDLSRLVAALLWAAPGDGVCTRSRQVAGPIEVPDASEQPQRLMSFEIRTRGEELTA